MKLAAGRAQQELITAQEECVGCTENGAMECVRGWRRLCQKERKKKNCSRMTRHLPEEMRNMLQAEEKVCTTALRPFEN